MSMLMSFAAVSDNEIRALLVDPDLVWRIVSDPEVGATEGRARNEFLTKLFGKSEPVPRSPAAGVDIIRDGVDIDKSWNLLHFLLSGDPFLGETPLNFILCGGESVGEIDVGYGPARVMRPSEVSTVHEALSRLSEEELSRRYDPKAFREDGIYPSLPADESDSETLEYMFSYLEELRDFMARCTESGSGALLWLW